MPPDPSTQRLRFAKPGEDERLAIAARRAFQVGTTESWQAYFRDNTQIGPRGTLVCEEKGAIRGQASLLSFQMKLAGATVPMKGFAAVATAPEARRAGVADLLMKTWLDRLHARREGLALLYAFHAPFYQKFGFGRFEWMEELPVVPAEIPPSPKRRHVRILEREKDAGAMQRLYERATQDATGPIERTGWWWNARVFSSYRQSVIYDGPRGPEGYLLYDVVSAPKTPATSIIVKELAATSPDAMRGLLGFCNALGDQMAKVTLVLPRGEGGSLLTGRGPERALLGYPFYRKQGHVLSGALARIVTIETALALHPAPARSGVAARIGLDLDDPLFRDQRGGFDVTFDSGARIARGRRAKERLAMSIDLLAAIFMGGVSARLLHRLGLVEGSARAAASLDTAFAGPTPFLWPLNGF
ncbi:MAG: GNAT family N-acetyltransferase [Acidobacteriota bacterium]